MKFGILWAKFHNREWDVANESVLSSPGGLTFESYRDYCLCESGLFLDDDTARIEYKEVIKNDGYILPQDPDYPYCIIWKSAQ